jgi:hypothetical protein
MEANRTASNDMTRITSSVTAQLLRAATRTPFAFAPERGKELAEEIFGHAQWELRTTGEAQFYALPGEAAIAVSSAGVASLWCLSYAAYHLIDIASRAQRNQPQGGSSFDIGPEAGALNIDAYIEYARSLFHGDREWPELLDTPDVTADLETASGLVNNVFFGAFAWLLLRTSI